MKRRHLTIVMAALLAACSSSSEPGIDPDMVSLEIGPAGGTFESLDGRLRLTVPAGAVSETTTLTIAPVDPEELGSEFDGMEIRRAYELGPDGMTFNLPLSVRLLASTPAVRTDSSLGIALARLLSSDGTIEALASAHVETSGDSVFIVATLSHFSVVAEHELGGLLSYILSAPDEKAEGENFTVHLTIRGAWDLSDVIWQDNSPIDPNAIGNIDPDHRGEFTTVHDEPNGVNESVASAPYRCIAQGQGHIEIRVNVESTFHVPEVSVGADVNCTPPPPAQLTIEMIGDGEGTVTSTPAGINCGTVCEAAFPHGTPVMLTATATSGSVFVEFDDCVEVDPDASVEIVMDTDRNCKVTFDREGPPNACEQSTTLDFGTPANGTWEPGDCEEGSFYADSYEFSIDDDGAVTIDVTSGSIHYLELINEDDEEIDFGYPSNFDGPVTVYLTAGPYTIKVKKTTASIGSYILAAALVSAMMENCKSMLSFIGIDFASSLSNTDCAANSFFGAGDGQMFYKFSFVYGAPGENVTVSIGSGAFTPALVLFLFDENGNQTVVAHSNPGNAATLSVNIVMPAGGRICIAWTSTGINRGANVGAFTGAVTRPPG